MPSTASLALLSTILELIAGAFTSIIGYVFFSLALTRLTRGLSLPHPALAWIPCAQYYRLGQIADLYTDNRLTTDEDRADPFYTPSTLRRKLLGYGIGSLVTGGIATVCYAFCIMTGITFLSIALGGTLNDEANPPVSGNSFLIAALVVFVAGILLIALTILFLLSYCPALRRIFTALDAPVPSLLTAAAVLVPAAGMILLYVYASRIEDLPARFTAISIPDDAPAYSVESDLTF